MVLSQGQMKSESELSVRKVRGSTLFVLEQPLSHTNQPAELNLITPPEQEESLSSGVESGASSWDRSVSEVKGQSLARLQDDLRKAHDELRLKDEQISRLTRIRTEVEAELEELTASLFQEAHSMVREANVRQAGAEKSLKESLMQIEVLSAEVAALKALVLTSTPACPNPHLHPQIKDEYGGLLRRHRRSPSHLNLNYGRQSSPPKSPTNQPKHFSESPQPKDDVVEVDPIVHKEFLEWKENPTLDKSDPFIARIYREDIETCLLFTNKELSKQLSEGIQMGEIFIEAVSDKAKNNFPRKCALLETVRQCQYRLRIGNSETWHSISFMCRNRIIAVCDFLNYLRYIQRGLVKSSDACSVIATFKPLVHDQSCRERKEAHEIYWEIVRLRKEMVLARLGLALSS
ncbi:guanine nucleotide exchange factor for Rab-3A-like isoform X4 [Rhodnius prolixus]|uniref:guanine nucleotide exchange factor for Rab-3A-like isoform X4 n=1 Tax=Rhodnius prolixus TaxID=13249 RepID=UPI003D18DE62